MMIPAGGPTVTPTPVGPEHPAAAAPTAPPPVVPPGGRRAGPDPLTYGVDRPMHEDPDTAEEPERGREGKPDSWFARRAGRRRRTE
jgi:hypothetical protein